jgi:hypothetical protein
MRNYGLHMSMTMIGIALLLTVADCRAESASCRPDEYEVMSLLIRAQYDKEFGLILINRDTEPWCLREQLTFLQRKWTGLSSETIDSLIVSNSGASCRLAGRFRLPVEYRLVSDKEYLQALLDTMDCPGDGTLQAGTGSASSGAEAYAAITDSIEPDWDNFDRVFPDAQGYLTFSRVGFDSGCTQALVIFSNAYRCSGARLRPATRKIAFFSREKGAWELVGVSRGIDAIY